MRHFECSTIMPHQGGRTSSVTLRLEKKRNRPSSFYLINELAFFHADRFSKRKGSVFFIFDKPSQIVKGLEVYPWLLIPISPSNPTKRRQRTNTKGCHQHPLTLQTAFKYLTRETLGNSLCLCHHTCGNLLTMTIGY